jgi:hypothetical protein
MVVFFLPALRSKAATVVNRRRTRRRSSDFIVDVVVEQSVGGHLEMGGGQCHKSWDFCQFNSAIAKSHSTIVSLAVWN